MTFTAAETTTHYVPQDLPTHIQHYINGEFVDSVGGKTFDVLDPVSNTNYATAAAGQKEDIDLAVAAAREAFTNGPWPKMKPRERARVLNRIADAVEAQEARLAELETFDTGLPITQAQGQALRAAENFRFFADLIVAQFDDAMKVPGAQINYVNRKPIGVAGLITPWNTPFMLESWKLAPALATGNTVVLKPAEFTPLSASLWAQIFKDAGLPDGVFNLVNGLGEEAGDALVKHPDVPLISFTGETTTGPDDLPQRRRQPQGPVHGARRQVPVRRVRRRRPRRRDRLRPVRRLLAQRRALHRRLPHPGRARRSTTSSATSTPPAPRTSWSATRTTRRPRSARWSTRSTTPRWPPTSRSASPRAGCWPAAAARSTCPEGNYIAPTVFADVAPDARIFQEEIFGPVVAITPFENDDEALALANNTKYGLAAYIWTQNLTRAHNFSQNVEAGMVWLNSHNVRDLRTPFGGVKASGLGHEGGYRSIDFYTDQQAVHITLGAVHTPKFGA